MVAAAESVIIPASKWGKAKTASQMAAILAIILEPSFTIGGRSISWYLVALAVVLTIWSGADYFLKARERLHLPEPQPVGPTNDGRASDDAT
jgi:CDP-diacylglycerol--glycerol-3-phosphate 3-phosphatidyltransferase